MELSDVKVQEKEQKAEMHCIYSKPNAKLRWFKNKLEIFQGHKYNFVSNGGDHRLVVNRVGMEDGGRYTCQCDENKTSAWIYVQGLST